MAQTLLHIGYPKSGSKYLQQWFEKHPQLYYQPKYLAMGFYNAWELAKFAENTTKVPDNFVLSCEDFTIWQTPERYDYYGLKITHPYDFRNYQNNICEILHRLHPAAKVLIVTRGYNSIFSSIYSQHLAMAGSLTFKEFINENLKLFMPMLDYSYIIDMYRTKFGRDKVIVLPFELLRDDASKFLSLIESEMGIAEPFKFQKEKIHGSYTPKILSTHLRFSQFIYNILKPLPVSHLSKLKLYSLYMQFVRKKEPQSFFVWLSKFIKTEIDFTEADNEIMQMKGKADLLKSEELYKPYYKEYFIE